jgi:hypothetical protein
VATAPCGKPGREFTSEHPAVVPDAAGARDAVVHDAFDKPDAD